MQLGGPAVPDGPPTRTLASHRVVSPEDARRALRESPYEIVIGLASVTTAVTEVVSFFREVEAVRVVRAPRAWLAEHASALGDAVDELVAEEAEDAEVALRLRWATVRRRPATRRAIEREQRLEQLRVALPVGCTSDAVATAGAVALAALSGVVGVRIEREPPDSWDGAVARGEPVEVPAAVRARVLRDAELREFPLGAERLLVAPLGAGALVAVRASDDLDTPLLVALAAETGRALDAALLLEAEADRAFRLERAWLERSREVERVRARLARVSEARDAMLAFLSHDVRSPLTVLVGHCQMLNEGILPAARRAASLETIRRQADRLSQMAGEVVDRQRALPEERGVDVRIDLGALAEDAVGRARPLATRRSQSIGLDVDSGVAIDADAAGVGDIVDALVDATLHRVPEGGAVTVRVLADGARARLTARGDGPAWPATWQEIEATPAGRALSTAMARARERGGEVRVGEAAAAELVLELPRAPAEAPPPIFVAAAGDADVATLVELLAPLGGPVAGHPLGAGLSATVRRASPAVVVVDGTREPGAALDALERLRKSAVTAGVPTVFLAPPGAPRALHRATASGVLASLVAPVDGRALLAAVIRARREGSAAPPPGERHDPASGLPTLAGIVDRLQALVSAARAARAELPALTITEIGPRADEPGRTRSVAEEVLAWLAAELRPRALPGDLLARIETDALVLVSPTRTREEMVAIWDELRDHLARARPRIGVTRVAVRARLELSDLAWTGEDPLRAIVVGMRSAAEVGHAS